MIKRKLTRLEQTGIIALVVIIACLFYVKRVYEPQRNKVKAIHKKWDKLTGEVKVLRWEYGSSEAIISSIQEKEKELRKAKTGLNEASAVLGSKEDLSEILTEISQLAGARNLKIQEFSPVNEREVQDDEKVFLKRGFHNLIMVGGFLNFKEFLRELSFLPKFVMVKKIVIERENYEGDLRIDLLLSI